MLPVGDDFHVDTTDDYEDEVIRALGDVQLGKRIIALKNDKYPYATIPELIYLDWLDRKGERYTFQAQLFGGWRGGGLVPDFVVSRGGQARAILVNGTYWHQTPGKTTKDASDKLRLLNSYFNGVIITNVVIIWESRLMSSSRDQVMEASLVGIEMGP